jgi:hypothetical protein
VLWSLRLKALRCVLLIETFPASVTVVSYTEEARVLSLSPLPSPHVVAVPLSFTSLLHTNFSFETFSFLFFSFFFSFYYHFDDWPVSF